MIINNTHKNSSINILILSTILLLQFQNSIPSSVYYKNKLNENLYVTDNHLENVFDNTNYSNNVATIRFHKNDPRLMMSKLTENR